MAKEKRTLFQRLKKNLHRAVSRPFTPRHTREETFREAEIVDLQEFTGLPRETVLEYLRHDPGRRISNEHAWVRPRNDREYAWFYRGSRVYMFDAYEPWHRAIEHAAPGKRILDFGGGGGRNSIGMARKGAKVFYVDLGVMNATFVAFRARKHKLDITIVDPMVDDGQGAWRIDTAEAARRVGSFDLIVADNVLEHVVDYHLVVEKLGQALAPGGRLLECTPFKREKAYLFGGPAPWDVHLPPTMPMEEATKRAGLVPAGEGLWEKPARVPAGA